jgi:hypothetical protein
VKGAHRKLGIREVRKLDNRNCETLNPDRESGITGQVLKVVEGKEGPVDGYFEQ